ncbi:hypothetical protein GDO81_026055 [Engystomops pustulosus]|uniref:Uncharacterized protein n=1 Tax=Engystomops pustulosus TaxID=76066 RepID=A0AAV6Z107_ENGPU|nr:hypothetical protein GDO81_026055 [Engystomops pustulosus]
MGGVRSKLISSHTHNTSHTRIHYSAGSITPRLSNMGRQKEVLNSINSMLRIRNKLLRQALSECLGTLILVTSPVTAPQINLTHRDDEK